MGRAVHGEELQEKNHNEAADYGGRAGGSRPHGRGWLKGKLRLRGGCELQQLLQWEKFPVSHESLLKSALERSRWAALFPLWPCPQRQQLGRLPCLGEYQRPCPLKLIRSPEQRNRAKMKEQCKTSETELSKEDIANISDGEFKVLVIKMLADWFSLVKKWKNKWNIPKIK